MLHLKNISVSVEGTSIISDLSLEILPGQMHVCMGPNGSGKSSLAYALAGHPRYEMKGLCSFFAQDILSLSPDKRAQMGIFLSMQQPQAVAGVTVNTLLKESFRALHPESLWNEYEDRLQYALTLLDFDASFLTRSIHDGFSGGEKKRCEMVQLLVLRPKLALLDEIDSGLDIDALQCVGKALVAFQKLCPESSLFLITHYQRILKYILPDVVHVIKNGKRVAFGNYELVTAIQEHGYDRFK